MRFITFHWAPEGRAAPCPISPLPMVDSLAAFKPDTDVSIVCLAAPDAAWEALVEDARQTGASAQDARRQFQDLAAEYPQIVNRYSPFEAACLLRWPVLRRLMGTASPDQIWHVDSDMLFFTSLEELARDTAGKTFALQGCPAFTSIADPRWFEAYESALRALHDTGSPGFPLDEGARTRHRLSDKRLGNASLYRIPPASDQDLIQCLIAEGRLPQDPLEDVLGTRFYYLQNPLVMGPWHPHLAREPAARFVDDGATIRIGDRIVPFVHFQSDAARFFHVRRRARAVGLEGWLPHPLAHPHDLYSPLSRRYTWMARALAPRHRLDRATVMRRSLDRSTSEGNRDVTDALNHLLEQCLPN